MVSVAVQLKALARKGIKRAPVSDLLRERTKQLLGLREEKSLILLPPRQVYAGTRRYLAAVAIMRNEGPDLREWLEFNRLIGIEHVYLYDDGSTDGSAEIVRPYVASGFVTYIPWGSFFTHFGQQHLAYAHALGTFGPSWRWMTFIDIDEFLFPVKDEPLCSALSRYEDLPAIAVPWHMFGFGGHESRPAGLVIENYVRRLPFPPPAEPEGLLSFKSIVDPMAVGAVDGVHFFILQNGRTGGFTEDRLWVVRNRPDGWEDLRSGSVFRLNHYFTKSREDFARRRSDGRNVVLRKPDSFRQRALQYAAKIETEDAVEDDLILRYVPRLRSILSASP